MSCHFQLKKETAFYYRFDWRKKQCNYFYEVLNYPNSFILWSFKYFQIFSPWASVVELRVVVSTCAILWLAASAAFSARASCSCLSTSRNLEWCVSSSFWSTDSSSAAGSDAGAGSAAGWASVSGFEFGGMFLFGIVCWKSYYLLYYFSICTNCI